MTLPELYASIDGNYAQAQKIMKMDKLITRYLLKLEGSKLDEPLRAAAESMDPTALFESTHAMKGVCGNLGLDMLAAMASELSEEFRPGTPRSLSDEQVKTKVEELLALYARTMRASAVSPRRNKTKRGSSS